MTSKASSLLLFSALCLTACSEFKVEKVDANRSLLLVYDEAAGENCAEGGKRFVSGVDVNLDGALEGDEIVQVGYICSEGEGKSALIEVVEIAEGDVCQFGGQLVRAGVDLDGDGALSEVEIRESYTLCSGTPPQRDGSIAEIATFLNHSCALLSNQSVQCWGRAADGTDASPAPMAVPGIAKVREIAAGCALSEDGLVRCWSGINDAPRAVPNLSGVKAIAGAASHHKCALLEDGGVKCWGRNDAGQLGIGNYADTSAPLPVLDGEDRPLTGATAIAVGLYHSCALLADETAVCWGWNGMGQLGAGSGAFSSRALPVRLSEEGGALGGVAQLALGYGHSCALLKDGSVACWGSNEVGQLGQQEAGNPASSDYPLAVSLGEAFEAVAIGAGYGHSCAIDGAGAVKCWGWNVYGQLGNAAAGRTSAQPVAVDAMAGARSLALGEAHSCALLEGGRAKCWGNNSLGQFGNGVEAVNAGYALLPSAVVELEGAVDVAAGYLFSCALVVEEGADGEARCWGNNEFHQLGNGNVTSSQRFPSEVQLSNGSSMDGIAALALGYTHACALLRNGTAWCWGDNGVGQLGNGTSVGQQSPVRVGSLTGIKSLAAGHAHGCALRADETAVCWGYNAFGQLGNGTTDDSARPVEVQNLAGAKSLALGRAHSCAVVEGGEVMCWGNNAYGQLGEGSAEAEAQDQAVPVRVSGIEGAVELASGHAHLCALHGDGSVTCWGSNLAGESGAPISAEAPKVGPTKVALPGKATAIASGYQHTCAILEGETLACWGSNAYGQLGHGQLGEVGAPVLVSGLAGVQRVATGHGHTCAALKDGTVKCWGQDRYGQLGQVNGDPRPVDAVFLQ